MTEKKMFKKSKKNLVIEFFIPQESHQFHKLPVEFFHWQQYLSPVQFSVLLYITSKIHQSKGYAYPSLKTATNDCNISENTFLKSIECLEKLNLIFVDRQYKSNRYYLLKPNKPDLELIEKHFPKQKKKVEKQIKNEISPYTFVKIQKKKESEKSSFQIKHQNPSNYDFATKDFDVTIPQKLKINSNSKNLNLSQSNSNLETTEMISLNHELKPREKTKQIEDLVELGFQNKQLKQVLEWVDSDIDIKKLAHYIFNIYCKDSYIKNKPGFFFHAVKSGQIVEFRKYEKQKKKIESERKNDEKISVILDELKVKLFEFSEIEWKRLSVDKRDQIKSRCKEEEYIEHLNLSEELNEAFYIEFFRDHYLEIDKKLLEIIDQHNVLKARQNIEELTKLQENYGL